MVSRAHWRRLLGLTWWDDEGVDDVGQYHAERFAVVPVEATRRCECAENGRVCATCRERNKKWTHPLDGGHVA